MRLRPYLTKFALLLQQYLTMNYLFRFFGVLCLLVAASSAFAEGQLEKKMLSHVEKILVVDSINVDRYEFFRNYRLQPSAGAVLPGYEVAAALSLPSFPDGFEGKPFTGFTNEFRDYMIWAQEDSTGYLRLAESVLLADGSWSAPEFTSRVLNFGEETDGGEPVEANAAFPFMLDDGQTLYFAADNEFSLGGYDIFVATKDPSDGEFLIPGNLGMPFNSPFDDYLMVLDRQTGVGWWASDRNQLDDEVTVYIFAIADERVNVDPDDENLMAYASLEGWRDLQDEESREEALRLRNEIARIHKVESRSPEFDLPMPGGKRYHFYSDFRNRQAADLMKRYVRESESLAASEKELKALRSEYFRSGSARQLASRIQSLEVQLRDRRQALKSLLSDIYKAESR